MDIVIKFNLEFNNSILDNEIQENNEFDEITFFQKENKIEIIKKSKKNGKIYVFLKFFIIS